MLKNFKLRRKVANKLRANISKSIINNFRVNYIYLVKITKLVFSNIVNMKLFTYEYYLVMVIILINES